MNFYQAQDQARKQTYILLFLFFLAVMTLVVITNFCVAVFFLYSNPEYALNTQQPIAASGSNLFEWLEGLVYALGWKKFIFTSIFVCGVLGMAMGFKWLSLREGGRVVAESLGGRVIAPNTGNVPEKRLLNVVEEIALASGTPVPQIYLLEQEEGINAFAAGLSPEDAVIGVTQGCLLYFNRDQLQGVIAHEFSHILNGDMRLNMKLLAVLHGILMIGESGRTCMSMTSRRSRGYGRSRQSNGLSSALFVFGLCLWLIGMLGQLFGALIKSAVSRQREFLADASAVQFTRNPDGIGEALSIIGGASLQSGVAHKGAHELAHLFFSNSTLSKKSYSRLMSGRLALFATHPPLEDRIQRILPKWRGRFLKVNLSEVGQNEASSQASKPIFDGANFSAFMAGVQGASALEVQAGKRTGGASEHRKGIVASSSAKSRTTLELVAYPEKEQCSSDGSSLGLSVTDQAALFENVKTKVHEPFDASILMMALLLGKMNPLS